MSDEIELKFEIAAGDGEAVKHCLPLAGSTSSVTEVDTIYFDTKDGLVRRAGYSLRVRKARGRFVQTVKHRPAAAAGLFIRREWETEVPSFVPDDLALAKTPLRQILDAEGAGPLRQKVRSRFRRTIWDVTHRGSVIEVVLDEGRVTAGREQAALCELELELISGKPRILFALAESIGAAVPLRLGVLSKAERAYALAEQRLNRAVTAEPVILPVPASEGDAFRAVAHSCLRHYRLNEMVLLDRRDAVALHQGRVALRRLRSALSLFRPTIRGKDYSELRQEIGWLADQLSEARDLDVLLAGEEGGIAGEEIRERLLLARNKAYHRVEEVLGSERVRSLMLKLSLWIEAGTWRFRDRSKRDLAALAADQLGRQWRRVKRHGVKLGKAGAADRHRLRLDVKKLRYSAEFLSGLTSKRSKLVRRERFIAALRELQEHLGALNDTEGAKALTARIVGRTNAGRLRQEAEAAEAIAAAEDAMKAAFESAGYWE